MVTVYAEVERLDPDELRRVMDVNFFGRSHAYRAALPHLRASRGTFVDVNSALAYRGIPLQAAYCASKAAARAYFESARVELEHEHAGVDISSCSRARSTRRSSTAAARSSASSPSRSRRSTSRSSSPRRCSTAAERPERELPVTWGAQKLLWGQKLSPRAGDLVLLRTGWKGQTTGEPKPVGSPDNLLSSRCPATPARTAGSTTGRE